MTTMHIFGDSLMKGTVINGDFRYRATMRRRLERFGQRFPVEIYNHSRFGITVEQGRELLDDEINSGMACDYVLLEFGGNDCNFDWQQVAANPGGEHCPMTRIERFKQVLSGMVRSVKGVGAQPVLMTLPPICASKYLDYLADRGHDKAKLLQWLGDREMLYRFHEMYSRAVEAVAAKLNALLMDVRTPFLSNRNYHSMIGCDGLHLSEEGYDYLEQLLTDGYARLQAKAAM